MHHHLRTGDPSRRHNEIDDRLEMWGATELENSYTWRTDGSGSAASTTQIEGREARIRLTRKQDGVCWKVTENKMELSVNADAAMLREQARKSGITFVPHPMTTELPWMVDKKIKPKSVRRMMDKAICQRMTRQELAGFAAKVKMEQVAQYQWAQRMQLRVSAEIWRQSGCITACQMWIGYRDATG